MVFVAVVEQMPLLLLDFVYEHRDERSGSRKREMRAVPISMTYPR
jgi:hypothetical protein